MEIHWDLVLTGIINFALLVYLFRKGLGDKIVQQIEKRKALMEKLKKADEEYKKMIEFAHKESDLILSKAEKKKKDLIHDAHLVAEGEKKKILTAAEEKAKMIEQEAQLHRGQMEKQLQEEWVDSVKFTAKKVVKRLLKQDKELSDQYFNVVLEDIQH